MDLEKEMLAALIEVIVLLAKDFKDGVQASDFADIAAKIMANEELKKQLMDVYNNIDKVKTDFSAMKLADGISLVAYIIPKLVEAIAAVKA